MIQHRRTFLLFAILSSIALFPSEACAVETVANTGVLGGIAVASDGTVAVFDLSSGSIRRFAPTGPELPGFEVDPARNPSSSAADIDVDADGNVFVVRADGNNQWVKKFSPSGALIWRVDGIGYPAAISVGTDGSVLVGEWADGGSRAVGAVRVIAPDGSSSEVFRVDVSPPANNYVVGIDHDADGRAILRLGDGTILAWNGVGPDVRSNSTQISSPTGLNAGNCAPLEVRAAGGYVVSQSPGWGIDVDLLSSTGARQARYNTNEGCSIAIHGDIIYFGGSSLKRLLIGQPQVQMSAPTEALTGAAVTLSATASADLSSIERFEWDTDGDGSFETTTVGPSANASYPLVGSYSVKVRAISASGVAATAAASINVKLTPPQRPVGVSINSGALFTNDPLVELALSWPAGATHATIANDGGFANAVVVPVGYSVSWKLAETGLERLPKTVYVRYSGVGDADRTFQDDVVLDQTAPAVIKADEVLAATSNSNVSQLARAAAKAIPLRKISLSAEDATSGVDAVQVSGSKDQSAPWARYATAVSTRIGTAAIYVRARDAAGNVSPWRTIKARTSLSSSRLTQRAGRPGYTTATLRVCLNNAVGPVKYATVKVTRKPRVGSAAAILMPKLNAVGCSTKAIQVKGGAQAARAFIGKLTMSYRGSGVNGPASQTLTLS